MEIKKFDDQKAEQIKTAEVGLNIINEVKKIDKKTNLIAESSVNKIYRKEQEFESILEDPEEATKQRVADIASTVAQIKEVGLSPDTPAVANWVEQELGVGASEFNQILNNSETPEDVQKDVLTLMEAPQELIDKIDEDTSTKQK